MAIRTGFKVYVDVGADFTEDGKLIPRSIVWEDDIRYMIDRIKKIERCASRKAGGAGILYLCSINGKDIRLFYEENYRWFVEAETLG